MNPTIQLLTIDEVQNLILREMLTRAGLDPDTYMRDNRVNFIATWRLDARAVSVAILGAEPKSTQQKEPVA